jgi:hypothetical protein
MGIHYGKADFINYGKPSLFLDFANKKSLVDRISGNNLITFERASTGTYVGADRLIKYAAADEPRFDHNPETGESLGLLIEESRTNLYDNTTNFGSSNWVLQTSPEVTLNTTDVLSPDGTFNAVKWTPTTTLSQYVYDQVGSLGSSLTYTMSVWVRTPSGESTTFQMNLFSPTQLSPVFTATDTWKRFTWTFTPQSQSTAYPVIVRELNKSLYIWGPQIEVGSFATSYIPTDASTVTRQPDIAQITGTNFSSWYNQNEGTWLCNFDYKGNNTSGSSTLYSTALDSSNRNWLRINYTVGTPDTIRQFLNFTTDDSIITVDDNVLNKISQAYASGDQSVYINGSVAIESTRGISTNHTTLDIGNIVWNKGLNDTIITGYINKLAYYPERLTNAQLQSLTQ